MQEFFKVDSLEKLGLEIGFSVVYYKSVRLNKGIKI